MLVHNHVNRIFQCVAVRAPGFGDRRLHKLEDIAAITGGAVHSKHSGVHPGDDDARPARPGRPRSESPPTSTAIIGGAGSTGRRRVPAQPRCAPSWSGRTFGIDEDVLTERIGALSGKVARDQGRRADQPPSSKELQHRVEDALVRPPARRWPRASWPRGGARVAARRAGAGRPRRSRTTTRSASRSSAGALTEPTI